MLVEKAKSYNGKKSFSKFVEEEFAHDMKSIYLSH